MWGRVSMKVIVIDIQLKGWIPARIDVCFVSGRSMLNRMNRFSFGGREVGLRRPEGVPGDFDVHERHGFLLKLN
jgi:hypothetical protein